MGTKQALREIYQNFLDFGQYNEEMINLTESGTPDRVLVKLSSEYNPENLEFLRIGNSNKNGNSSAIGKHGEGLKMAFLILLRQGDGIRITTDKYIIEPCFYDSGSIGKCFGVQYTHHEEEHKFTLEFECPKSDFLDFHQGIIGEDDYLFTLPGHGSVVNKEKGNIYSGGLFVCNLKNFTQSYDIPPNYLPLDRDREVPRSFDVAYHSSKVAEAFDQWDIEDIGANDTSYIDKVPARVKEKIRPVRVGNSVEFVAKDKNNQDKVITNSAITDVLKRDNFFQKAIKKIKHAIIKNLGLYDLLVSFQEKHVHSQEAIEDFKDILAMVKKSSK